MAKANLKDFKGAIDDYNKASELNPKFANAYNSRGLAKGNLFDHKGALQDFNLAIKANPELSEAYQNRGTSKFQFGDKLGACLDWSKAGELGYYDAYEYIKKYCNQF